MKYFFVALLFLAACGEDVEPPTFKVRKIKFFDMGANPEFVVRENFLVITDMYFNALSWNGHDVKKVKERAQYLQVKLFPEILSCPSADDPKGQCFGQAILWFTPYGLASEAYIRLWLNNKCIGKTAYIHEISHWARAILYTPSKDSSDGNHDDPEFYGSESITQEVNDQFIRDYCQEG